MLVELHGKGGCLCQPARQGKLRCPLIVRPTSEDVVTGHLFQVLQVLNPHWWLADFLNMGLDAPRFRRQVYSRLRIELWQKNARYPRELLGWEEGNTEVDCTISWENPPTTVFIEMKYGSDLSGRTANNNGQHGYPADQLIRNARLGLFQCGYLESKGFFTTNRRDFVLLLVTPRKGHPLVTRYRDPGKLRAAIPRGDCFRTLPRLPFIGELSYGDVIALLRNKRRWFTRPEQNLIDLVTDYLALKRNQIVVRHED